MEARFPSQLVPTASDLFQPARSNPFEVVPS
jgi:hypothetical protein